jgi:uncharacterized protein YydD (DUF2326 family)
MKYTLIILALIVVLYIPSRGQTTCPAGSQCVKQATIDKCNAIADELIAARDAINKLKEAASADAAKDVAAQRLIAGYERLVAIGEKIQLEQGSVIDLYKEAVAQLKDVVKMQFDIISQLEKRLTAPKSALSKFLSALKDAAILIAGVAVGLHL